MKKQESNSVSLTGTLYGISGNNLIVSIPRTKSETLDYIAVQVKNVPDYAEGAFGVNNVKIEGVLAVAYSSDPTKRFIRDTIVKAVKVEEVNVGSEPVNFFAIEGRIINVTMRETTKNVLVADIIVKSNNINFKCVAFYERALAAQNLLNQNVKITGMLQYRQLRGGKDIIDLSVFTLEPNKEA